MDSKVFESDQKRFLAVVENPDHMGSEHMCVDWTGYKDFFLNHLKQPRRAARAAWILFANRGAPTRLYNTCGNAKCCNWRHYSARPLKKARAEWLGALQADVDRAPE